MRSPIRLLALLSCCSVTCVPAQPRASESPLDSVGVQVPGPGDSLAKLSRLLLTDPDPAAIRQAIVCEGGRLSQHYGEEEAQRIAVAVADTIYDWRDREAAGRIDVALAAQGFNASCGTEMGDTIPTDTVGAGSKTSSVNLEYVCGNTFRVRNSKERAVAINWVVPSARESGALTLRPRPADSSYSETFFSPVHSGAVRLYRRGTLLQAENGRKACLSPPFLYVVLERGVVAIAPLREGTYPQGTVVPYSLAAEPGYENLLVTLDDQFVTTSGTVTMSGNHVLIASADRRVEVPDGGDSLAKLLRRQLTDPDPVRIQHAIQCEHERLGQLLGPEKSFLVSRRVADTVYTWRDRPAIRRVDSALGGHSFTLDCDRSQVEAQTRKDSGGRGR